jgi:hypothetical protein
MKTKNYFQNAVLAMMVVLTASFTFNTNDNDNATFLNRENAEFASAGYWIDAVIVNGSSTLSDKELMANKGYYIEPVVVTYDADKALLANMGYYIEPVVVTCQTIAPVHVYASK